MTIEEIIEEQEEIPPEFDEIFWANFWELLA